MKKAGRNVFFQIEGTKDEFYIFLNRCGQRELMKASHDEGLRALLRSEPRVDDLRRWKPSSYKGSRGERLRMETTVRHLLCATDRILSKTASLIREYNMDEVNCTMSAA